MTFFNLSVYLTDDKRPLYSILHTSTLSPRLEDVTSATSERSGKQKPTLFHQVMKMQIFIRISLQMEDNPFSICFTDNDTSV